MSGFRYTHALVSRIPNSFKTDASGKQKDTEIDLSLARQQLENYVGALRKLGVDVIELPSDESSPDCCLLEDLAIVINGTALIGRPAQEDRIKEAVSMKAILQKELPGLVVMELADKKATLEGGDVLFTGKEIFVGLSGRTNVQGARAVALTFPEYPVTPVKVTGGTHLRSLVTMAAPGILAVDNASKAAHDTLKRMEREATFRYKTVLLPDEGAANCSYVNGTLIHRCDMTMSDAIFRDKMDFPRYPLNMSEFSKVGATLSSLSILIHLPKLIKRL